MLANIPAYSHRSTHSHIVTDTQIHLIGMLCLETAQYFHNIS